MASATGIVAIFFSILLLIAITVWVPILHDKQHNP